LLERPDVSPVPWSFEWGVDLAGNIIAGWLQLDGRVNRLYASRYEPGAGWSMPEQVPAGDTGEADDPVITVNPSGHAIMMWNQYPGQKTYTYARLYVPGVGWGATVEAIEGASDWRSPVTDAIGNAMFLYEPTEAGATPHVYAKRYDEALGWEADEVIDLGSAYPHVGQLAMDPHGNAIAVWSENNYGDHYARRYGLGTGWGPEQPLSSWPWIRMDSEGSLLAVWSDLGGLYARRYEAGVGWHAPQLMWADPTSGDGGTITDMAMNLQGQAVVVWGRGEPGSEIINTYANYFDPTSGWHTSEMLGTELNTTSHGPAWTARAVIDENGRAVVVWRWYDQDNVRERIYGSQYSETEGWSSPQIIVSYSPWNVWPPWFMDDPAFIRNSPGGDAFLVWEIGPVEVAGNHRVDVARFVERTWVPRIGLYPPSLELGTMSACETMSRTVLIYNYADVTLNVSGIERCDGTSSEYTWSPDAPFVLDANSVQEVVVGYAPVDGGVDVGCLALLSDDPDSPRVELRLSGSGPDLDVSIGRAGDDLQLDWADVGADSYEVWYSVDAPHFEPGVDCGAAANCTPESSNSHVHSGAAGDGNRYYYVIRAVWPCGSVVDDLSRVGKFGFGLVPGGD
jgi:hypothetical protein